MNFPPLRGRVGAIVSIALVGVAVPQLRAEEVIPDDPATAMVLVPEEPPPVQTEDGGDLPFRSRGGGNLVPGATGPDAGSGEPDDHNPIGVTGIFNGNVTTGCSYDPLSHSAHRAVDDIVVTGTIGKYPLKMTRYYNSRAQYYAGNAIGLSPGWSHEYSWLIWGAGSKVVSPQGNVVDSYCELPVGISEWWEDDHNSTTGTWRLADGGKVVFTNSRVSAIVDPYGQTTTITYDANGYRTRVTEPGGRYLQFIYGPATDLDGTKMLTKVEAHGLGTATVTEKVIYTYTSVSPGGSGADKKMLTGVAYDDGTTASYTYRDDNVSEQPLAGTFKFAPVLATAYDKRYRGPMRQIAYDYANGGFHGAILAEKYSATGPTVSSISGNTETRGDGPTRTFSYTTLSYLHDPEGGGCPDIIGDTPSQFLLSYTDFQGNPTTVGYDDNWFIDSVKDANNHETLYDRGPSVYNGGIGQILKITHPDTTFIQYTYENEPSPALGGHYVKTITDERGNKTIYTRDPVTYRITAIGYRNADDVILAQEDFQYNSFGQVTRHHLKNGAYVHYQYDGRGLLTTKWEPTPSSTPVAAEPKTTYTYHISPAWADRLMTETRPANASGQVASETYEYDRNTAGDAVPGRGMITKIIHADDKYQSAGFSQFGDKVWEQNELRQQTNYTTDTYHRVLTVSRVMAPDPNETTTYTYKPTNGTGTNTFLHTTSNPDTVKTPTNIITAYDYDENFRKVSATQASGTSLAATTQFGYDNVGNLTSETDPLNHVTARVYDGRNRKTSETLASGTSLAKTTSYAYDEASNIIRVTRPDLSIEFKFYDGLNRVYQQMVPRLGTPTAVTEYTNTWFAYNPSGTIATVTDGNSHVTSFAYDESDRRTEMTYHDGSSQSWEWDDVGNLASRTTVNGEVQSFTYDNRNRKTDMSWSNAADWATFGYDDAGRLTSAVNPNSAITREYDLAGRLTLDRQNLAAAGATFGNKDMTYDYNADGNKSRLLLVGTADDYTYSYDAMGRFEKILSNGTAMFQYFYDAASNETQRLNNFGGVAQIYTRDELNRMTRWDLKKGTTAYSWQDYDFDAMSRLKTITYGDGSQDQFTYYLNGELKTANYGATGHNLTYNLDRMGNRTSVVDNSWTSTYTPNELNQYTGTVSGAAIYNEVNHQIGWYAGWSYSYLNDEHLKWVQDYYATKTLALSYDALGRCVKRTLNGVATYYIYDGERPIREFDSGGGTKGWNIYGKGIDEIVRRWESTRNQWYLVQQNRMGNVTHLIDFNGNTILERCKYDAFGAPTIYAGATGGTILSASAYGNRFFFTGREYNPTFGFYEYRARAYHPGLGRFTSEDPKLYDAGDYNLFRYCHNDPLDLTDPMGLDTLVIIGDQRDDSTNVLGHASMGMTHQGVFSSGTLKTDWGISASKFVARESEHRKQEAFIIPSKAKQEAAMRQSLESRRDKPLPSVLKHPIDAARDNCATRVRDALKAGGHDVGRVNTPAELATALEKEAKNGRAKQIEIPAQSQAPQALQQFEPMIDKGAKEAGEHISNLIHSKPDPQSQ